MFTLISSLIKHMKFKKIVEDDGSTYGHAEICDVLESVHLENR